MTTSSAGRPSAPTPQAHSAHLLARRRFLALLAASGTVGAAACRSATGPSAASIASDAASLPASAGSTAEGAVAANAASQGRAAATPFTGTDLGGTLVVIELQGGADGLTMVQPLADGILQDARPDFVTDPSELIPFTSDVGWHPELAGFADLGASAVTGVGSESPSFSHFEMERRWWRGNSDVDERTGTGFLGRICDQVESGAPATGLSLAGGATPALASEQALTIGVGDPDAAWYLIEEGEWLQSLRNTMGGVARTSPEDDELTQVARAGLAETLRFADSLVDVDLGENTYPWTGIGQQLRFAADIIGLDLGVRVLHVTHGGFDTHSNQQWKLPDLLTQLNEAVVAFAEDLQARGKWDSVVVATTSEFGRRVAENDGGTDHGGASTMLVVGGPVSPGLLHGEASDLRRLDAGNLVATSRFEDYYGALSGGVFGVDPSLVLPGGSDPFTGLFV